MCSCFRAKQDGRFFLADVDGAISTLENLKRTVANRKVDRFERKDRSTVNIQNQLRTQLYRNAIATDHFIAVTRERRSA